MSMEQFSVAKEERQKEMGSVIITADQSYDPGAGGQIPEADASSREASSSSSGSGSAATENELDESGNYKPKVSTWGVFPRPNDISKAYGGGRDIKPGASQRQRTLNSVCGMCTCTSLMQEGHLGLLLKWHVCVGGKKGAVHVYGVDRMYV